MTSVKRSKIIYNTTRFVRNDFMLGESMLKSIRDRLLPMEMEVLAKE